MKKWMYTGMKLAVCAMLLCLFALPACAEEAKDITDDCKITVSVYAQDKKNMLDNANLTMWETPKRSSYVEVETPKGQPAQGIYVKWGQNPLDVIIQVPGEERGEWVDVQTCNDKYQNQYIAFEKPLTHFRMQTAEKKVVMGIIKFQVLGEGELPDWVQTWEPPCTEADLLLISSHSDDEQLFFAGILPYYAVERQMEVQVAYVVQHFEVYGTQEHRRPHE